MAISESSALPREEIRNRGPVRWGRSNSTSSHARWCRRGRTLALVFCDQLGVLMSVLIARTTLTQLWPQRPWPDGPELVTVLSPGVLLAFGTHELYRAHGDEPGLELRQITLASSSLFGVLGLASVADGRLGTWTWMLGLTWILSLFLVPSWRAFARLVRSQLPSLKQRVLVLGDGEDGHSICYWLKHSRELGFVPIGPFDGSWSFEAVERVAREEGALHLVVTPSANSPDLERRLSDGDTAFEHVTIVPWAAAYASAHRRTIGSTWGVTISSLDCGWTRGVKRSVDIALGVPLFLVALPLIGALALCIKLVSPGPALFRHRRVGLGGREFDVFKLRSMCTDANERLGRHLAQDPAARDEWERHFKLAKDPRLLPVIGPLLRKTSLDELPQLLNVLRGEMSLVGPRPLPPYHISSLPAHFSARRHRVLPGLTGLWQVSQRSNGDKEALIRLDEYYLCNWSIWLDLRILARTAWAVISGRGAL